MKPIIDRLGFMQGRLSQSVCGKIQSFPTSTWQNEFRIASDLGLKFIEWVIDFDDYLENPLMYEKNLTVIKELILETRVNISSVCVDYFSTNPPTTKKKFKELGNLFRSLSNSCSELDIDIVEIPLIGEASFRNAKNESKFVELLEELFFVFTSKNIKISLETDLEPETVVEFINMFSNGLVGLNYDVGNSAYWGFDMKKELSLYGDKIFNVHLKDCTPEEYSVPFGEGTSNFTEMFYILEENGYKGNFILQGARYGDELACLKSQVLYVKDKFSDAFSR